MVANSPENYGTARYRGFNSSARRLIDRIIMDTMMVATCRTCRAWYAMDFEEAISSEHYNARTGRLCDNNEDNDWAIRSVPYREDWQDAN